MEQQSLFKAYWGEHKKQPSLPASMQPVLAFLGPSGVGKSTILSELCADPAYQHIRPVTTRAPRVNDWDRETVSLGEFERRKGAHELYNCNLVYTDWYAYSIPRVQGINMLDATPVVDIVLPGVQKFRKEHAQYFPEQHIITVLVTPPNEDVLRERLESAGRFNPTRWAEDIAWLAQARNNTLVDEHVENDTVANALQQIRSIKEKYS